ncbi:hypothetical protein [Chiayiivirga flava]|uniref:hypothetical protein n=1 Tax=Chiayiivirga flava TaxID=659595 RepID=UPI001C853645|nr:hypothetical protein [Chiayiivirga flava]
MTCAVPLTPFDLRPPPARTRPAPVRGAATQAAPARDAASVRRSTSPCPFPLRVVALGHGGADADLLLAPSPMITVQAELAMTPQAIRELVMLGPDVAVVDLRDVPLACVAAQLRRIHGASRRTRIVALVPDEVAWAQQALLGGATACIPAAADRVAVLRAVHDAARNRLHLGGAARTVLQRATAP